MKSVLRLGFKDSRKALIFGTSLVTFIFILFIIENVHKLGITHKQKIPKICDFNTWINSIERLLQATFNRWNVYLTCISHIITHAKYKFPYISYVVLLFLCSTKCLCAFCPMFNVSNIKTSNVMGYKTVWHSVWDLSHPGHHSQKGRMKVLMTELSCFC